MEDLLACFMAVAHVSNGHSVRVCLLDDADDPGLGDSPASLVLVSFVFVETLAIQAVLISGAGPLP